MTSITFLSKTERPHTAAPADEDLQGEMEQLKQRIYGVGCWLTGVGTGDVIAAAKWTVGQLEAIEPDWDEVGFYGR